MTDHQLTLHQHEARAFREGRQTQFRRVLKPRPVLPYAIGDRLWCRETALYWRDNFSPLAGRISHVAAFRADGYELEPRERWSPPNHMPRRCSRTTLTVTDVRVQRLQEISEADAKAEGVEPPETEREDRHWRICPQCGGTGLHGALGANLGHMEVDCTDCDTHKKRFRHFWNSINGPAAWDANPWVIACTVEVTLGNIDGAI